MSKITPIDPSETRERKAAQSKLPAVGEWYWVTADSFNYHNGKNKNKSWLCCVTHVGSNYFQMTGVGGSTTRIHVDTFENECKRELDADAYIKTQIAEWTAETKKLMGQVAEITRQLAVSPNLAIENPSSETAALVLHAKTASMQDYKKALIKANATTLPELFKKIEAANKETALWMKAELIPLEAQAKGMQSVLGLVQDRIFNVELYAGLVEEIALVRDGEPAAIGERVRLMQRRHYMDEECLSQYETGGMELKDIRAFDKWLAKKKNFLRVFPFPRCVVAFQVRRNVKEREWITLRDLLSILADGENDKLTFLYLRNGEKLYRLSTEIEFDEKLFPDMDRSKLSGVLYAKTFASSVDEIITEAEYQGIVEDEAREEAKRMAAPKSERWRFGSGHRFYDYVRFDPSTVHYDDIAKTVSDQMKHHNRIGLILQGLFDRSPVFHPHPPWSLYTPDGFERAVELVYDDSRALTHGEMPDFAAYRARLNVSIKRGSITIGQHAAWENAETAKAKKRYGERHFWYQPYGNPGPGKFAAVASMSRTHDALTYEWLRKRQTHPKWPGGSCGPIYASFTCTKSKVFHIDAYTPGDFKQFYADPRTRAEYLKWAPLLLEAEEWHAGNRKIEKDNDL